MFGGKRSLPASTPRRGRGAGASRAPRRAARHGQHPEEADGQERGRRAAGEGRAAAGPGAGGRRGQAEPAAGPGDGGRRQWAPGRPAGRRGPRVQRAPWARRVPRTWRAAAGAGVRRPGRPRRPEEPG